MKHNKLKSVLATALLLASAAATGQASAPRMPLFRWVCESGDILLNHNPATTAPLRFDSIPYAEDYTVVVVYKPVVDTEATVWQFAFADSIVRGLTTEHILSDGSRIRYSERTAAEPAVSTLRQTAPDSVTPYVSMSVNLEDRLMVSEVLYFGQRLGDKALRRVQTELAIRYGITLGPVNYIDAADTPVWNYKENRDFHHNIVGIAHDTASNLVQLRSRSEGSGGMLTLAADSLLPGEYLLCGDNHGPLAFATEGATEYLGRQWKLQGQNTEERLFSMVFDIRSIPPPADSLVLMVCDEFFLPASVSANEVRYDHVYLPTDTCQVRLARNPFFWQVSQSLSGSRAEDGLPAISIFPNPTTGIYNIEVGSTPWVRVVVYDLRGTIQGEFRDSDRRGYHFSGTLPSGNAYFVTIATENGTQAYKLVVK